MRSLTAQLTLSLTVAVLVLGGLFLDGLHYSLRHLAVTFLSARLAHDLDSLVTGVTFGREVTVLVTEDFDPIDEAIERLQLRIGLAGLAVLAGLLIAQYLIVRGGLRPLTRVRHDIQRLSAGEI